MAGGMLTITSTLMCPHGGSVQIISANTRVTVGGAPAALATDLFLILGCPFQIPVVVGTIPSPCLTVQWLASDLRSKVNGMPTLSQGSAGLCLNAQQVPQGPVVIAGTEVRAQSK